MVPLLAINIIAGPRFAPVGRAELIEEAKVTEFPLIAVIVVAVIGRPIPL